MFKKLRIMYYRWCLRLAESELKELRELASKIDLWSRGEFNELREDIREMEIVKNDVVGKLKTLGVHVI